MANSSISLIKSRMRIPEICAPMFLVTGPQMVIKACKSGVMGCFPATNARTTDELRGWLDQIAAIVTDQDVPWAMNMITLTSYGRFNDELALVGQYQPELVITALAGKIRV